MRTGEERREFQTVEEFFEPVGFLGEFALERDVLAGQLFHSFQVAADGQRLLKRLEQRVEGLQRGNGGLRLTGVVPEVGLTHQVFQPDR